MAYVPDDAIQRLNDISPAAGRLYLFFCRWRDHETGYSRKNFDTACKELGVSRPTYYRLRAELLRDKMGRSWVTLDGKGRVGLLVGDFSCVDKTPAATSVWKGGDGLTQPHGGPRLKAETSVRLDAENETKILKPETVRLKAETGHIEDHARDSSSRLSSNLSTTPLRRPGPAEAVGGADVVDGVSEQDYFDFAHSQDSFYAPDSWARKHWKLRDSDDRVLGWKRSRAAAGVETPQCAPPAVGLRDAIEYINARLEFQPGADVREFISSIKPGREVERGLLEHYELITTSALDP